MAMLNNKAVDVDERRLRSLYDCIDSSNNKRAIQEADKVLKKHPNLLTAKALKALGLIRLSRAAEAECILVELTPRNVLEERSLTVLAYCFKELNGAGRILPYYEEACANQAGNEELMLALFNCYVRERLYKKQQQQAMQLYKHFNKQHYYFWAVMSIYMQAQNDPKMAKAIILPLSEKMVRKKIEEKKIEARAEVELFWMTLIAQDKFADALDLLDSQLISEYGLDELSGRRLMLLQVLERWKDVHNLCLALLPNHGDSWILYENLLNSTFHLISDNPHMKTEYVQNTSEFVMNLADGQSVRPLRGPQLARLKLIMGLLERDMVVRSELGTSTLGEPLLLLTHYFVTFGDRPVCYSDMHQFLCLLGENQKIEFLGNLLECCGLPGMDKIIGSMKDLHAYAGDSKQLMRHACCLQLHRALGVHKQYSIQHILSFAAQMVHRYRDALKLDVLDAEDRCGDVYLILALSSLWDVLVRCADSSLVPVLAMLSLLGSQNSACVIFKLVLAKLYALLGASVNTLKVLESLDFKGCLLATSGYYALDQLTQWGLYSQAQYWFQSNICAYFRTGLAEIRDSYKLCYQHGAFQNVVDMTQMEENMRNSVTMHAASITATYVHVLTECQGVESVVDCLRGESSVYVNAYSADLDWTKVNDSRDFSIIPLWASIQDNKQLHDAVQSSFKEICDMMRLRQLLLQCVALLCRAFVPNADDDSMRAKVELDMLRTVIGQLKAHYRHCRDMHADERQTLMQGPLATHFNIYLQGGYFETVSALLDCAYDIYSSLVPDHADHTEESMASGSEDTSVDMQALLRRMFSSHLLGVSGAASPLQQESLTDGSGSARRFPQWQLCHCSYLAQTISLSLIICQMCAHRVDVNTHSRKRNKKKNTVAQNGESSHETMATKVVLQKLRDVSSVMCNAPATLARLIQDLHMILDVKGSVSVRTSSPNADIFRTKDFNFLDALEIEANDDLSISYETSLKEMSKVCSHLENTSRNLMSSL